jgi:hypothetical protein
MEMEAKFMVLRLERITGQLKKTLSRKGVAIQLWTMRIGSLLKWKHFGYNNS